MVTHVHSSGDDVDGCLACWNDGLEGECCVEPCDDGTGSCGTCGHAVEPTPERIVVPVPMTLPMTGECE